jgi:hypothetical protein
VDHDILRQLGLQDLVPANHLLVVLLKNLQQTRVEVSLQRVVVFDPFLLSCNPESPDCDPIAYLRSRRRRCAGSRLERARHLA